MLVAALLFLPTFVLAGNRADCTNGRADSSNCIEQLKKSEKELANQQEVFYKKLSFMDRLPSGTTNSEAIDAVKKANSAWENFRNAECESAFLVDGTSAAYVLALTESCKLNMTRKRIRLIKNSIKNID